MFESLVELLTGSPWTYVAVLGSIAGSAVFPLLPSESMIVTAGVLAGTGELQLPLVMLAGAIGAFLGDTAGYWLGRGAGQRAIRLVVRGEKGRRSLQWAERALTRRGGPLVVVGRFIPGGRTAVSVAAGALTYPWPRYAVFAGIGSVAWALYGSLIGFLGAEAFRQSTWKALLLALGLATVVGGAAELARRRRQRR